MLRVAGGDDPPGDVPVSAGDLAVLPGRGGGVGAGDLRVLAAAASVAGGAWWTAAGPAPLAGGWPRVPLAVAVAGAGLALVARRPGLVCAAAAVLAVALTQRSLAGLDGPVTASPVHDTVTLVSDPEPTRSGGVRADARLDGRRLALRAHRSAATALEDRLVGERVVVVGEVQPPGDYEERMLHRHLAGRLRVDVVVGWQPGHGVTRLANGMRRTLAAGTTSLPDRQRSLLAGLVLGDRRDQPADLTGSFREAGLTHLLAVSGSDVAVVLAVAGPLLRRLRLAPRLVVSLLVLGGFALVTRGEPSVLRATAMAVVAVHGAATGRPVAGLRSLGLGVAGLLLVDPLLVTSVGFQLSVAGTAGIILGAPWLAAALPGPRWLALAVAVTVAAQLAVAPLLVATFGSMPLVALPANLLAAPVAGPLKAWGLTAGLVAGIAGDPVAAGLHLPSGWMLGWLDGVARTAAGLPVGDLRAGHLAVLVLAGGLLVAGRRGSGRIGTGAVRRAVGGAGVLAVVVVAALGGGSPPEHRGRTEIGPGLDLWRGGGAAVVVLDGRAGREQAVEALRRQGVDRLALVVVRTTADRALGAAGGLVRNWPEARVLVPPRLAGTPVPALGRLGAPEDGATMRVGDLVARFRSRPDRLDVELRVEEPP